MRYLSKIIREKSGLDGDGTLLVGQAFGGDEPKLRLNKLQTQSEKDEQKGFQFVISGLYSAIRNPRTHEDIQDDKNSADPIIYFINYICNVIDVAKPPFTIEDFLPRIFDKDFVVNEIYTKELIKEIPRNKYLETLIEIYREKAGGHANVLSHVVKELLSYLSEQEKKDFMAVISSELDVISNGDMIVKILQIIPSQYWSMVKLTAKMRIENKLIASILTGKIKLKTGGTTSGAFGTWATKLIDQFTLKEELANAIVNSLISQDLERNRYIFSFFLRFLPTLITDPDRYRFCARAMKRLIKVADSYTKDKVLDFLASCPDDWLNAIRDEFAEWTDEEKPEFYLRDGSPFLGKVPYTPIVEEADEDEFPF
jgi:uncharacterized protein (TIGR02391 family)